jgi:putative SOS response-associated peptidase YedK
MCGRVNVSDYQSIAILMEEVGMPTHIGAEMELSENLFPYYKPLVAGFINEDDEIDSTLMNWGWQRNWDQGKRLFNSRRISTKGQVIWQSPVWGEAIRRRRCLVPINAFYEWDQNQPKGKRNRYRIQTHEAAFTLGGIFEISEDGELFLSICTTDPNEKMAEIHHRMPVIIDAKDTQQWLASDNPKDIDELMQAKPENYIRMTKESQIGRTDDLF